MKCSVCGFENRKDAKFCERCGNLLDQQIKRKKRSKWPLVVIFLIVILAAGIGAFFGIKHMKEKKDFESYFSEGEKYLNDHVYKRAESAFLSAVSTMPEEKQSYIYLADIYMEQDDKEKALDILEKAVEIFGEDQEIIQKKDEVEDYFKQKKEAEEKKKTETAPAITSVETKSPETKRVETESPETVPAPVPETEVSFGGYTESDYREKLAGIESEEVRLRNNAFDTSSKASAENAIYTLWDNELNYLWPFFKPNMSESTYDVFLDDQIDWIHYKEDQGDTAYDNAPEGEADYKKMAVLAQLTKERVYYLTDVLYK